MPGSMPPAGSEAAVNPMHMMSDARTKPILIATVRVLFIYSPSAPGIIMHGNQITIKSIFYR
jgi:hypothetical protein